ncbi:MAG: type II toxin-antitoxin system VapC family toxin [Nevskia sp.]|nr:type II toxin-antitoxin system VapC family toxin [Nevskia sp.]
MYLVDTNVISELRKGAKANAGVREFWKRAPPDAQFIAVQTVGELRAGVESIRLRGDLAQAQRLEIWLQKAIAELGERILPFDEECAQIWGALMARNPHHSIDKQIAAIALIHNLTVVTRNVEDFAGTGVKIVNPFT